KVRQNQPRRRLQVSIDDVERRVPDERLYDAHQLFILRAAVGTPVLFRPIERFLLRQRSLSRVLNVLQAFPKRTRDAAVLVPTTPCGIGSFVKAAKTDLRSDYVRRDSR